MNIHSRPHCSAGAGEASPEPRPHLGLHTNLMSWRGQQDTEGWWREKGILLVQRSRWCGFQGPVATAVGDTQCTC